jgi:phosphohistidine phosphatase
MGAYLAAEGLLPDMVLCSSATRTRETLACLGGVLPTILSEKLYLASAGDMLAQLQQCDDAVRHVMIIGHNPGTHELVVRLMGDAKHESDIKRLALKFPTCALAQLSVNMPHWQDLALGKAQLESFVVGKELPEIKQPKRA